MVLPEAGLPGAEIFADARFQGGSQEFLGANGYADRRWQIDYPARKLSVWEGPGDPEVQGAPCPLGFATDAAGQRQGHFARIQATIDGETLDFLFDTGATIMLTDEAAAAVMGGTTVQVTSFITRAVFERWQVRHPDWRVLEVADRLFQEPAIEVPTVTVGGHALGPVWFTRRPDRNFHESMSQYMDQRIDGALGGSLWRHCRVTVDYPRAVAYVTAAAEG